MTRQFLRPEVDTLRQLPLAWVLAKEGLVPNARGRYFCPVHPDEATGNPSADVWEREDGDVLGCWSCGAVLDVFDLLLELRGLDDYAEAIAAARELADGGDVPERAPRKRNGDGISAERLERELRVSTTNVRYPDDVHPLDRFAADYRLPPVDYLAIKWGWAGDFRGRVVIPHRAADGTLTGLRYRHPPTWVKGGRVGSRFRQLYGLWRLGFPEELWLCEGETDTVWAGYHLEPLEVGVVGLVSASQRPDVEPFRGRTAVLALDPDEAGQAATARWRSALAGVATRVITLRFEKGKDLRRSEELPTEMRTWSRAN